MKYQIILLTNDSIYSRALANTIASSGFSLPLIVVENSKRKKRLRNYLLDFVGIDVYSRLSSIISDSEEKQIHLQEARLKQEAVRYFKRNVKQEYKKFPRTSKLLKVAKINQLDRELDDYKQCAFVVFGSGILKGHILVKSKLGSVNFHTSLLPNYRGTFPEFWQLYNMDYTQTGYSIHLLDEGVDTGPLLFQKHVPFEGSNPFLLRAKNVLDYLITFPTVLKDLFLGKIETSQQTLSVMNWTYRYSDIDDDHKKRLYLANEKF